VTRRWVPVIAIAALLVVAGLVDRDVAPRSGGQRSGSATAEELSAALPIAAPASALSSTWYCAAGTAAAGGSADLLVVVVNPGSRPVTAEVTAVATSGRSRSRTLPVPARGRARIAVHALVTSPYAAALVEVEGGGVAVEREVAGKHGYDAGPCASHASDRWLFAAGSTVRGADEELALFNPYPGDASVDIDFATEQGPRSPRALQAFPVPGRSLRVVRVTPLVSRRSVVATRVVARSGRLVVDRLQVFDGRGDPVTGVGPGAVRTAPPRGLSVTLGMADTSEAWAFPAGRKVAGAREQLAVYNPSGRDAEVQIEVTLDDPVRNGRLDPFPLSVPAGQVRVFDVTDQDTVPDAVDHSFLVRSTNGVGVVAEQVLTGGAPWPRVGVAAVAGSPLGATRWLFAAGGVSKITSELLVLQNLTGRALTCRVQVLAGSVPIAARALSGIRLPAAGRVTVRLDGLRRKALPLLVEASGPIVAERTTYLSKRPGLSFSMGVPLSASTTPIPQA